MLSQDDIDKLRAEYPQGIVHLIGAGGAWEAVFRAPSRTEYKMFRANVHNSARIADANETLSIQTVVFPPSREAFNALLDRFPAIPEALANNETFRALTGVRVEEGAKP